MQVDTCIQMVINTVLFIVSKDRFIEGNNTDTCIAGRFYGVSL